MALYPKPQCKYHWSYQSQYDSEWMCLFRINLGEKGQAKVQGIYI